MAKRPFLGGLFGRDPARTEPPAKRFPPVPLWRPSFAQPRERVIDRVNYYANAGRDFCVLTHGTCVILEAGLSDAEARAFALQTLSAILHAHPDMHPNPMDDGNILVSYNHPAVNVVLADIASANWDEIERRHLDGLPESEVLITPLGQNIFDDFGKQALLGRAWMFMDAQAPEVMAIVRAGG